MRCLLLDERMQRLMHDGHFSPDAGMIGSWLAGEQANEALPVSRQTEQRGNRLAQARDYILGHLADPALSADRLAQALCMSRRALFLLFAEQGLTPTRMIQELRLERCRALLDDPQQQNKIIAIALDHGFRDYVTFSRQFKARFGIAPSDFRKRAGAGSLA
jgi:AraC-like DNA-binding protein